VARTKYQVLVIPYYIKNIIVKYCIFYRTDMSVWQFIAGGGEEEDSSVLITAKREAYEEANIDIDSKYISLDTQSSIPTYCFKDAIKNWGEACLVIPEYSFAVKLDKTILMVSHEHTKYEWVDYETALKRLKYDSNKTALWELDSKIKLGLIK
jgi:dATP pyrophosphohydrolase